jgi:hypothetical protein
MDEVVQGPPADYIAEVISAVDAANPNAPEDYDLPAIARLSYYFYYSDYSVADVRDVENLYMMYDLLKFTAQD